VHRQESGQARRATLALEVGTPGGSPGKLHDIVAIIVSSHRDIRRRGPQRVAAGNQPGSPRHDDVERTARTALEEMGRMIGLLRPPGA